MSDLAVVIPAYKSAYFKSSLSSLANQTCKDFSVYIGDDCSPNDLRIIADDFSDKLDIHYTRFDNNIGSRKLVKQWERCVALSGDEKWIWLFSDDDLADPGCVENFYNSVRRNGDRFEVYRFNTRVIDKDGKLLYNTPVGPAEENAEEMAYHLLMGERGNSMPDHIFTRSVYEETGGFVYTEFAQGADWASSILFSSRKGIAIIPGSMISWRYSGTNISSTAANQKTTMIRGHLQFLDWVIHHFNYLKKNNSGMTYRMMIDAVRINIRNVFINHYKGFNFSGLFALLSFYLLKMKLPLRTAISDLRLINIHTGDILQPLADFKVRAMTLLKKK